MCFLRINFLDARVSSGKKHRGPDPSNDYEQLRHSKKFAKLYSRFVDFVLVELEANRSDESYYMRSRRD